MMQKQLVSVAEVITAAHCRRYAASPLGSRTFFLFRMMAKAVTNEICVLESAFRGALPRLCKPWKSQESH